MTMSTPKILNNLQAFLEKSMKTHDIPGASIAVLKNGKIHTAAAGVLNIETNVNVTQDSIFQIGSITKLFTTTLIMQLVDEGRLELDEPIKKYIPTFQVADMKATQKITVRHLISHTSGLDGDFFAEAGYGRDKLIRYLDKCTLLPQIHPPGEYISYCNSGFCIAGRLIEVATGQTWEEAICERIFKPLDMDHSVVRAEETLKFRTAVGHLPLPKKDGSTNQTHMVTPMPYSPSAHAPAGSTTTMTALNLLKFVQMHLNNGACAKGKQVLSKKSTKVMQTPQVDMPKYAALDTMHVGLGWMLMDWDDTRVIGHDGGTVGELAFLRVIPEQNIAIALLTNSMNGGQLYNGMYSRLMPELAGIQTPKEPKPAKLPMDLSRYIGRYETIGQWMEIYEEDKKLKGKTGSKMVSEEIVPQEFDFSSIERDHFLTETKGDMPSMVISFLGKTRTGLAEYIFSGARMMKRKH